MNRRDFLVKGACGAGLAAATGLLGCQPRDAGTAGAPLPAVAGKPAGPAATGAQPASASAAAAGRVGKNRVFDKPPTAVYAAVATNKAPAELVSAAVESFGGTGALIKKGDVVVIKPNLAWGREPEIGATTNPEVLKAVIKLAKDGGAKEVLVVEHSCDKSDISFAMSGAGDVCDAMGVKLISLDNQSMYEEHPIPQGVNIKSDKLPRDILECDVYINLPCLKHHGATNMTLCMKNQMGAIWDPQRYHREKSETAKSPNLHQNIADLATVLRPTINIVDAVRALTTNGPKGPGVTKELNTVIVTHDMVTADMLGAQLLGYTEADVAHIKLAADMGVGSLDVKALNITRV
jgi:uncharacterized protein (DUF362 family)